MGIDRFYAGRIGLGVAKLLTFGGFGIWSACWFYSCCVRPTKRW
nr:TM2 domain-containing protein [Mycoplasma sp. Mirounga ES2805-ORL]